MAILRQKCHHNLTLESINEEYFSLFTKDMLKVSFETKFKSQKCLEKLIFRPHIFLNSLK